jgi:hypothetical protein
MVAVIAVPDETVDEPPIYSRDLSTQKIEPLHAGVTRLKIV